jgi:hypothetical protein
VQVPEPVSPIYRSRVRNVSHIYRSQSVADQPEPHTIYQGGSRADDGIRTRDPHLGKSFALSRVNSAFA